MQPYVGLGRLILGETLWSLIARKLNFVLGCHFSDISMPVYSKPRVVAL